MTLVEQDIIAGDIKLHVYRTGTNRPALVFAHGLSDNGLCFWSIAQQFADDYEIILYDSRNHGLSDGAENLTLEDRAHDLVGLITILGIETPTLIGHSLGAVTIALYAGLYPDVPRCVVLEDPPPFEFLASTDEQAIAFKANWRKLAAVNKQKSIDELIAINRAEDPTWPDAEQQPWAISKQQLNLYAFDEDAIDVTKGNHIVSQITCPTLILTADLVCGAIHPPQMADALAASMSNVSHVNIPNAGHNIRREQPAAYLSTIRAFLSACS